MVNNLVTNPARRPARAAQKLDALPPHSEEIERAALAAVLVAGETSQPEADALLLQLRPQLFYGAAERTIHDTLTRLRTEAHAVDSITVHQRLVSDGAPPALCELANNLRDSHVSVFNFPTYLATLREFALRRWTLQKSARMNELAGATELTAEALQAEFAELYDKSQRIGHTQRARLKIWRVSELMQYEAPAHQSLVGDNEINMGYEGLTIVAGPGSSGKSLAVISLAVAGATGAALWMGRKVHRRFKTLVIQAENGSRRLKEDMAGYLTSHPENAEAINAGIFFSDPPEGGLCFNSADFRAAARRQIEECKPDLVVIDPWQSVAAEDAAKEVVEMLNTIRSCFPSGDDCPGLLIVAHTNKPRADVVRKGRNLVFNISGSVSLVNTARCVYMLLPWSDEVTDHRIYWACVKLNNGEMYAPSVWHRRKGAPFDHDDKTDPQDWGKSDEEDSRHAITEEILRTVFEKKPVMKLGELSKVLAKRAQCSETTAYRAVSDGDQGYLRRFIMRDGLGGFKLKDPE